MGLSGFCIAALHLKLGVPDNGLFSGVLLNVKSLYIDLVANLVFAVSSPPKKPMNESKIQAISDGKGDGMILKRQKLANPNKIAKAAETKFPTGLNSPMKIGMNRQLNDSS